MINNKRIIAIIPARGGSKGLPGKNLRNIFGKPLIEWTIEKAKEEQYLDTILVTTDHMETADISIKLGVEVPFIRPKELADDYASTYDVIRHALEYYTKSERKIFDYVVLLEPTSPLRDDGDIDTMLEMLINHASEYDSIVSVGEISEHPAIVKRLDDSKIKSYCEELVQTTRRQDNTPAYFPYGVAYMAKTSILLKENTFYTRRCMSFKIKRYQNYEIDDIYDFLCVEKIMEYEWGTK